MKFIRVASNAARFVGAQLGGHQAQFEVCLTLFIA